MLRINTTNRSNYFNKGLIVLLSIVFVLGLQLGTAYCNTIVANYSGEILTTVDTASVEPIRIAIDSATGNIFVSSPSSGSVLEYDQSGNPIAEIAGFDAPLSVAVDGNGRLFVGDSGDGSVSYYDFIGGIYQYAGDLGAGAGEFGLPEDIALSQSGKIYVTDSVNNKVNIYNASTMAFVSSFGSFGTGAGQFKFPTGIECDDSAQEVYVVDQVNGRVQVFDLNGNYKRYIGSFGSGNGKLTRPQGVFVKDGFVYVVDAYQSAVEVFKSNGTFVAYIGSYGSDAGLLRIPMDVAVDGSTLLVTNSDNLRIELFDISYLYSISGSVKTSVGTGIQNVLVTMSGGASRTATTDSSGNYTFSNLPPGSYTVTPSAAGFTFTSPLNVVITTADQTSQNITASSYNVTGAVTTTSGTGVVGVILNLTGTNTNGGAVTKTATTITAGAYSFTDLLPGSYTLTPIKAGYTFTPANVTISGANVSQNFIVQVYSISGSVTNGSGVGISAATMTITIGTTPKTATTATNGSYTITDVPVGSYTVTPSKAGYVFTQTNQAVTVSAAIITGVNFNSFTLSGTAKTSNGTAISTVLMTLSGGGLTTNKTATTSTTGAYSIAGLGNGTYTLTPSKAGYTFTPVSVTINNGDLVQDFTVQVYSISGAVTAGGGAGISAVTMTITIGTTAKTATTATNGSYTITDVPPGSYTATPSKTGYVFTPTNQAVTVSAAIITGVNFNSFTLSGTVKTSNGTAISTVLMTLSGGGLTTNKTATTSTTGAYSIAGLGNGTYTLTPSKAGYTFTPASVTINNGDFVQDVTVQVYSISGAVTTGGGVGISAVTMTITIGTTAKTATTATNGSYTITDVPAGSYTVTPSKTGGYVFTPINQAVTVSAANVTGVNFNSFTLSGTAKTSNGTAISGVLMTLSGGGLTTNKIATTATAGTYSITGLGNGTYTLTPSKAGYTFTPASVTINNGDLVQDFTVQVYSISGAVTTGSGAGISAVTMTITIGTTAKTATTATDGSYTITDVPVGSYTVTPSKTGGYVFTPINQAVTVSTANVTSVNFNSFTLSGTVKTSTGTNLSGVLMTLSGGGLTTNKTAITATAGTYSIPGLGCATYTLTPTKAGYTFTPASVILSCADQTQDFTVQVYSISGAVTTGSGAGISAVTMTITIGTTAKTATTATNGSYTITDVPVGSYTVTPSKTGGYVFTPTNQAVTVSAANVTDVNFMSFTLSGTAKTSNGTAISGVLMTLSGGGLTTNKTATTATAGTYSIAGLGNGTYTLTPSKAGYTFTPASVTINNGDLVQDFTVQVYSISGAVTTGSGTGISSVTMTIAIGGVNKTAITVATTGAYTITDVPPGSYTVTPTYTGYVFTPANQAVTVSTANVTGVNFNSYTLSGTVKTSNNTAISGVLMTLSGGGLTTNKTATTVATTGAYSIVGLGNGTYTLTPSKAGYIFTPASVTISNANQTQDFIVQVYSISGAVTSGVGAGISTVTMTITIGGVNKTVTTATTTGAYTITDVPVGSYTVTPSKSGYVFTPTNQAVTVDTANVTDVNFKSFTLSGTVKTSSGTAISGVLMTLSGGGLTTNKTATTVTTTGAYSIVGLGNGTYTLTPSKAGYAFTPASKVVTINDADLTQNFTGAIAGTSSVNIIAAAKGPDAINDAVVRIVDLGGSLISEFQTLSTSYGARVAMGDLLGDGDYEVIVAPGNGSLNQALLKIYSYNGTLLASLASVANTIYGASVVAGDIDGDGKDEIVMSRLASDMLNHTIRIYSVGAGYVLTQEASISFTSSAPVSAPANVAVGNLDGAGELELIVSYMSGNGTDNTVSIYTFDALMNPALRGSNSYPLGSTVSALNSGVVATEDIVLGYTDGLDSIVKYLDIDFTEVGAPVTVFVAGASAPTLSTMDIDADGELDLLTGMGDQSGNPALLTIYPSAGIPTDITVFESYGGVNADFGIIKR